MVETVPIAEAALIRCAPVRLSEQSRAVQRARRAVPVEGGGRPSAARPGFVRAHGALASVAGGPALSCSDESKPRTTLPAVQLGPGRGSRWLTPLRRWDLTGIIGTGQSLSVGQSASELAGTAPAFDNLKLALGAAATPPFDAEHPELSLVPLVEPIRPLASTYPSAYPDNIYGETPHHALASQVSALVNAAYGQRYVTVHSVVGENGQGMRMLRKGAPESVNGRASTGRAYAATLFEVSAIGRLAAAQGKTYGVGAIFLTHGETDADDPEYEAELVQLWREYNADLCVITGQSASIPLFVSQQHGFDFAPGEVRGASRSTLAQWRVGVFNPQDIVCTGPKYQYPYAPDNFHLSTRGYQLLGEKYGQVYFEHVVRGRAFAPLQPTSVSAKGRELTVRFQVPVPPLAWDEELPPPHQSALREWRAGRGFELSVNDTPLAIDAVEIVDADTVRIIAAEPVPAGSVLGYAVTSDGTVLPNLSRRWGLLRDSDPFVGAVTGAAQPNYAVAFEWSLP